MKLPMEKFGVILADPPWNYNNRKTGGERKDKTKFGGGAMKHYPLMSDADLKDMALSMRFLSEQDSVLFMWATMPRLDFAMELLKIWGFRYTTTAFTWIKISQEKQPIYGPGFYTASNTEVVLLGIRGSMPPVKKMTPSVIIRPRFKEHSRKPSLHKRIDAMYPSHRKIELFARRDPDPSWAYWGNEIDERNKGYPTTLEAMRELITG